MKIGTPDWVCIDDGEEGFWLHMQSHEQTRGFTPLPRASQADGVLAIASHDLISIPKWVNSREDDLIHQIVESEVDSLGYIELPGPGQLFGWKMVATREQQSLIQIVVIPWLLSPLAKVQSAVCDFLPYFSLLPPPENGICLWKEGEHWIAGYSRLGKWIHVHSIGKGDTGSLLKKEISLTIRELSAGDFISTPEQIAVWCDLPSDLVGDGATLQVTHQVAPKERLPTDYSWGLLPHETARRQLDLKRNRRILIAVGLMLALLLGLAGWAWLDLEKRERRNFLLSERIAANAEPAAQVQTSIDNWNDLGSAITPLRTPSELFYQVAILLPEKGFRLTSFEFLDSRTLIVQGEAASVSEALRMQSALKNAEGLSDYDWEIPPPQTRNGLAELFATGTYKY